MFISVDLPAPFSPSSACTSPRRTSRSTLSFATIPGNRFVIPRNSRTGGSSAIRRDSMEAGRAASSVRSRRKEEGAPCGAPSVKRMRCGLQRGGRVDLARDDQLLDPVHLLDERGAVALRADLADVLAAVLQVEDEVGAGLQGAGLGQLEEGVDGRVDALHARRQDVRAEVALVGVDADAPLALRLRGVEGAEATATGDLEDDVRALGDLLQGQLLALRRGRRRELVRVVDQDLDLRVGLAGARAIAGDPVVDRRDLLSAD